MPLIDLTSWEGPVWSHETKHSASGRNKWANNSWYRGEHTRFMPNALDLEAADAIEEYIVRGWAPPSPCISSTTTITAFGSCFAEHISKWLSARNYRVLTKEKGKAYVVLCGEGMVNTFAVRGQFEWAFENRVPQTELWHGFDAQAFGYDEAVRRATLALFMKTDVFILTFGLSEIWYDQPTGEVFWRAVPREKYDPTRHKFRVSSVEENTENIRAIYRLIRKHRPSAKVIFTLSPVPLVATFRDMPCISANTISKSILRVAVDNVLQEFRTEGRSFYWPSYEITLECFQNRWRDDRRHIKREILDYVMMLFEKAWCTIQPSQGEMDIAHMKARIADGSPVSRFAWNVQRKRHSRAEAHLSKWIEKDRVERVAFARRWRAAFLSGGSKSAYWPATTLSVWPNLFGTGQKGRNSRRRLAKKVLRLVALIKPKPRS